MPDQDQIDQFNQYLEGLQYAGQDASYFDWQNQAIYVPGPDDRTDLEQQGDRVVPRTSLPEKIIEAVTSTPANAVTAGLIVLAVIFSFKAGAHAKA